MTANLRAMTLVRPANHLAADSDDEDWRLKSACTDQGELFFTQARADIEAAKTICGTCPVRAHCLAYALEYEGTVGPGYRWGIYGGKTPEERTAIARKAAGRG